MPDLVRSSSCCRRGHVSSARSTSSILVCNLCWICTMHILHNTTPTQRQVRNYNIQIMIYRRCVRFQGLLGLRYGYQSWPWCYRIIKRSRLLTYFTRHNRACQVPCQAEPSTNNVVGRVSSRRDIIHATTCKKETATNHATKYKNKKTHGTCRKF